jgi:ligand-binding SRPBCC domain-containing protein
VSWLIVVTRIAAPIEVCFDLARSVDAHTESSSFTGERAIAPGRTSGLLELGDLVTFEGVHFGLRQRFTAKITEMNRPHSFVDELVKSTFRAMRHIHDFRSVDGATVMTDALEWVSPFGVLGRLADTVAVRRHMRTFLERKQANLKRMAEELTESRAASSRG